MRVFDSPLNLSSVHQSMKYKNHESPITKLSNLSDVRNSYQQSRIDSVLGDRTNEVFVPRNASRFIEEPFEKKVNREKEIEQIRKKYYEQPDAQRNTKSVSQRYDRYEVYRQKELRTQKRDQNHKDTPQHRRQALYTNHHVEPSHRAIEQTPNPKSYMNERVHLSNNVASSSVYTPQTKQRSRHQQLEAKQNIRPLDSTEKRNMHLDRISEASNSNYQTVNKTLEAFSPQKNRGKSSFAVDDRANRNKQNTSAYYFVDSFRNKENCKSIIKETTSVYGQSVKNSAGNVKNSHVNAYQDRDSAKSNMDSNLRQVQSRVEPYNPKPFSIEDPQIIRDNQRDHMMKPSSRQPYTKIPLNSYPTIYDNFLPKNNTPLTTQKPLQREQQTTTRPRTMTQQKRTHIDQIKETIQPPKQQQQKELIKRRVLNFGDDDRIKEIQKRLKERENQFRKKQQTIRGRCETQYDKNSKSSNQQRTSQNKHNVDKQIQRLSHKIKEFQDMKKELNIPNRNIQTVLPIRNHQKSSLKESTQNELQKTPQPKDYENARKALEEYRQGSRTKSSAQVFQVHDYSIPSSANNQESNCTIKNHNEESTYRRKLNYAEQPKEPSRKCQFLQNTKPMYSERTLPLPSQKRQEPSRFGLKLFKIQSEESEQLSTCRSKITNVSASSKNATNASQCRTQFEMHRRADDGIQQRKKRLQQNKKTGSQKDMKRLVSALSQQSIYDEEFRNCKIWFQNQRDQNKWKQLKKTLKQCNDNSVQYTELKDGTIAEFHICEDENNPFFSVNQQSKFTYQALVRSFMTCKKFWQQNILNKFYRNTLKSEGLTMQKFDLEKKGYINLEDFVRFLNLESGNFYRNRDLILIFKRFGNDRSERVEKSLKIDRIFDVLSY